MQHQVITIGEILWDVFPNGKKAGGSSMNVALNLHKQGINSLLISALGNDENGKELLQFLKSNDMPARLIQQHSSLPTSTVTVSLDAQQQAAYTINQPVAWDDIKLNQEAITHTKQADAFVYCSLTCRDENTQKTVFSLLKEAKLKVFDINLRAPFFNQALVEALLTHADILKLNEEELVWIKEVFGLTGMGLTQLLKQLAAKFSIAIICLTLGDKGACVLRDGNVYQHPGYRVQVVDTVGAGDAFLATFLACYLQGYSTEISLDYACKVGAFVASQPGANPVYNQKIYHIKLDHN